MGKSKAKPLLVVTIREGHQPTLVQAAAWARLWRKLLDGNIKGEAPAPGGGRGGDRGKDGEPSTPE